MAGVAGALPAWLLSSVVQWPQGTIGGLLQVSLSGALGLVLFGLIGTVLGVPEVQDLGGSLLRRFRTR